MNKTEISNETDTGLSPDMIEEKLKLNLEPLHDQISALTQLLDNLIQGNSAREFMTAGTREPQFPSELPLTDGP